MKATQLKILVGWLSVFFVLFAVQVHADQHTASEPAADAQKSKAVHERDTKKMNPHVPIIMWSNAVTVGSTRDFVEDYSFRGVNLEYRYRILPELSVGVLLGLQNFSDKRRGTESFLNGAGEIWGTQVRQLETVPLMITAHYYWLLPHGIKPFAGTDIGAFYKWRYRDFGWAWLSNDKWHFGIAPQIGVMIPLAGGTDFMFSTKFNYLVENGDSPEEMYISFHFGLAFME